MVSKEERVLETNTTTGLGFFYIKVLLLLLVAEIFPMPVNTPDRL